MSRDFSVHCEHCQSFPDGYYCSHHRMVHKDNFGKYEWRECWYQYIYEENWMCHPCPFFVGEIRFHADEKGDSYGPNHYAVRKISEPDGYFSPEFIEEAHY